MTTLGSMVPDFVLETSGYLAAGLVFLTFFTKTMLPLRYLAICSNIVFIIYALLAEIQPVLLLHSLLLPLNVLRLWQLHRLIAEVSKAASSDFSIEWLLPYMNRQHVNAGEYLFRGGDEADRMFYILRGTVQLPDIGVEREAGQVIGEIGLFSPTLQRTTSALCKTDCDFLTISRKKVLDLYYQNPTFGIYLLRLITGRLVQEVNRLQR